MTVLTIDSKRNIGVDEVRNDQPFAKHIVRLERNRFALMDDDEFERWKSNKKV